MQLDIATHQTLSRHCACALLSAFVTVSLLLAPQGAHAVRKNKTPTGSATHEPSKKKGAIKVKPQATRSDSQESTAERDRRLYRECKGMPNAGACQGYTRR